MKPLEGRKMPATLRRSLTVALLLLVCVACRGERKARHFGEEHSRELEAQTQALWARHVTAGIDEVLAAEYPPAVKALRPERVYVTNAGVFITTYSFFVEHAGLFVRHDRSYELPAQGDPGFTPVAGEVFWYYAPG